VALPPGRRLLRCGISIQLMSQLGHSLQIRPRPLVHKCPLCINTDRKFWALGFVAMGHKRRFPTVRFLIGSNTIAGSE
jgi:hypothetical protein